VPSVDEGRVGREPFAGDLLRRSGVQGPLGPAVVSQMEPGQQMLELAVAGDQDPQHLALHPAVEALDHPVGFRGVGLGLAVLDAELPAHVLEPVGGEARAAVGQQVGDLEREGGDRLLEERHRAGLGLVVLDRQVHRARAAVDGDVEVALLDLAVGGLQLRQVLDVDMHEAEIVVLEGGEGPLLRRRLRQPVEAGRLEDAVDVATLEVRQEMRDDEGEVVEREAGGLAQLADHRALLLGRDPGQLVRPGGAVLAGIDPALAPLADGLGADAVAPGEHADALGRAGDLGADHGRGPGVGVDQRQVVGLPACSSARLPVAAFPRVPADGRRPADPRVTFRERGRNRSNRHACAAIA
jgi:hypothetical protein